MSSENQNWDPKQYAANARFVAELGRPVLDLLAPKSGERILDLGCGDGALSLELARYGCDVVGVDSSERMVEAARSSGVEARYMDGAALQFSGEFDAVFSNATLHWIKAPEAVISGVWRALRPGGRFVAEFGGRGNVSTILDAIEDALGRRGVSVACPWFFPTQEEYVALLERAGFVVGTIELFPRPTQLPGDVSGWLKTFAQHHIQSVPESQRESLITEIVDDLRDRLCDAEGNWIADYMRLRFRAEKPRAAA
jgi:trans-aconitate methyltransferase